MGRENPLRQKSAFEFIVLVLVVGTYISELLPFFLLFL